MTSKNSKFNFQHSSFKIAQPDYIWGDNCQTWVLNDTPELLAKEELIPPGAGESTHFHTKSRQVLYITSGTAELLLGEKIHMLNAGDLIVIEPGIVHRIWNRDTEPLHYLLVSTPPDGTDRTEVPG